MHRDYVSIILFQLYGPKFGRFQGNLFWVGHPPQSYLEEKLIQYQYNFIRFLSNLSKIIPKTADIILYT